jgi:N-acetylglucosamine-6-phosphate deacetylase
MNIDSKNLLLKNCKILDLKEGKNADILIKEGKIKKIGNILKISDKNITLDIEGRTVVPGFIDVHIQGAGGADVLDGTVESLQTISQTCTRFGTTSFLATTVYRPAEENHHLEVTAKNVGKNLGGANLLGIHLEGPFISMKKKGMISPLCITKPSLSVFNNIMEITKDTLRIMTIAPELNGSLDIIKKLKNSRVIVSLGHSNCSYEEALSGIDAGISHVTHLFNAMPQIHHRAPGPLLAIFESKNLSAQIISDGVHIYPGILRLAFNLIGGERCILITDGMQAMGLPDGNYIYNGIEYESKDGTARYHDGTLIGTSLGLNQLVHRFKRFTNCSLKVAIKTVTENPARLLGIEKNKGSIKIDKDADIVILDDDFSIWATIIGGKIAYRKDSTNES